MYYSSTRGGDSNQKFVDVLLNGLANDGGLYVPDKIPKISKKKIAEFSQITYAELAYEVTKDFVNSKDIPLKSYKEICLKTYNNFSEKKIISLENLNQNEFILNLFNGPTFAFKDFALQLLGNLYDFILSKKKRQLTILGATSGDTGSAAIYGCSKSEYVKMFILFPEGKVSEIQRKQMTTFKKDNVLNIAVKGDFDDCQRLVKKFFLINNRKKKYNLAAINSINWVRIMGQLVYYFWSFLKVSPDLKPLTFVVPTGNFGNVFAGFIAKKMGLPVKRFVVASNKNDILTRFFNSGEMKVFDTKESLSPSMDIQISSNFERLIGFILNDKSRTQSLFSDLEKKGLFSINKESLKKFLKYFYSGKLSDQETINTIKGIYHDFKLVIDPHTAVGLAVGRKVLNDNEKRIYLATAHYGKFINTVNRAISDKIYFPLELQKVLNKKEEFRTINNDILELEELISNENKN